MFTLRIIEWYKLLQSETESSGRHRSGDRRYSILKKHLEIYSEAFIKYNAYQAYPAYLAYPAYPAYLDYLAYLAAPPNSPSPYTHAP